VTVPVKGYSGIVGVNDKGKVFEGEQVPVNKRMMEMTCQPYVTRYA
jgi:hypothetical protein